MSGFGCGWTLGRDDDAIDIYYLGLPPAPITLVNNPAQPLCRTTTYQLQTAGTAGAVGYTWAATNGARVVAIPGTGSSRMTLDLANVPTTATSVTVTVQPAPGSQTCTGVSQVTTAVLRLDSSPAPQNMQLINGLCPSSSIAKNVSVDPSIILNNANYEWTISGPRATFLNNVRPTGSIASIITPDAGAVTVSVRKKLSECAGYGPTIASTYQIGYLTPTCVQPVVQRDNCGGSRLIFEAVPSGMNYYVGPITNITIGAGITLTPLMPGSPIWEVGGVGFGRAQFDLEYYIQTQCTGPGGNGFQRCNVSVFIQKFTGNLALCRGVADSKDPAASPAPELYPNPSSGLVTISAAAGPHAQQVKVFDTQGSLRYEQHSDTPGGITSFDLKGLAPGMYLVQLFDGQRLTSQRLVKE